MPQPIDPTTELARLTAAQRVQELADRAQLAAQHRQTQAVQQQQVQSETQVQQSDRGEEKSGISDRQESNQERQRRRGAAPEGDTVEEATRSNKAGELQVIPDSENQHRLDISI